MTIRSTGYWKATVIIYACGRIISPLYRRPTIGSLWKIIDNPNTVIIGYFHVGPKSDNARLTCTLFRSIRMHTAIRPQWTVDVLVAHSITVAGRVQTARYNNRPRINIIIIYYAYGRIVSCSIERRIHCRRGQ